MISRFPAYTALVSGCLLYCGMLASCNTTQPGARAGMEIPYPSPLPDSTALIFLPGVVSSDSLDFNAAFSPDGRSFYFSRSVNGQTKIFVTRYEGDTWTAPSPLPFKESRWSDADPAFGPDGSLYFISNRPAYPGDTLKDYDIWYITPLAGGGWSEPENLKSLNSDSSEYYISFARNGHLYFASARTGGFGMEDIYVSKPVNGQYTAPENLGAGVNTARSEYDPGISAEEDLLVFASSNRDDTFGGADLYAAKPDGKGKWLPAVNLGKKFNTATREFCPYFSPDGKYFFFSSERQVKWIDGEYVRGRVGITR